MASDPDLAWGSHRLSDDDELNARLGDLSLRIQCREQEVRVAHRHGSGADGSGEEPELSRWAVGGDVDEVSLTPIFPDRPIVVEPEDPFWLLEGARARIYVRVALWVHVEAVGARRHSLLKLPTLVASDTWWGTVAEGELCYALTTRARRAVSPELFEPHLCVCPLQLVNRSDDDLHVDKIALRVDYLSIFRADRALWSDETLVDYSGDEAGSRLEMAGRAPDEARGAELLTPSRERMGRGFRARTFRRLRHITGLFG